MVGVTGWHRETFRMKRVTTLVGVAILGLGATACGGSGGLSELEQEYSDAIAASFSSSDADELQLDAEQADCVAPKWTKVLGAERLQDAGIDPADLNVDGDSDLQDVEITTDEASKLYATFGECDVDLKQAFVDAMTADGDMPNDAAECLKDALDDDTFERIMVASLSSDEADEGALEADITELFTKCATG